MVKPSLLAVLGGGVVWFFVAWIAYLSWPVVGTGGRLLRVFMLMLLAGLAATLF